MLPLKVLSQQCKGFLDPKKDSDLSSSESFWKLKEIYWSILHISHQIMIDIYDQTIKHEELQLIIIKENK